MALGYSGFAQIMDGSTPVTLLATSISINPELNPIGSSSAVGYGWYNAADISHYANGVRNYRGSIGFDMQGDTVWDAINKWALIERVYAKSFSHSPDGTRIYNYTTLAGNTEANKDGAWCTSLSFSTSTDSVVQANIGVLALRRTETAVTGNGYFDNRYGAIATDGDCNGTFGSTLPLNPGVGYLTGNTSPIPFWKTGARILINNLDPDSDAETVSWDVALENNTQIIKTCNGLDDGDGYGQASAIVQGAMSVTGNVELYKHSGVWDPVLASTGHPIIANTASFVVKIQISSTQYLTLTLPAVRLESDSYDMNLQGPTNRKFSIKGLGGKCGSTHILPPMIMS